MFVGGHGDAGDEFERFELFGIVGYLDLVCLEAFHQGTVIDGGDAEFFHAIVPGGKLHPTSGARRGQLFKRFVFWWGMEEEGSAIETDSRSR